jgi:hypothetical protein
LEQTLRLLEAAAAAMRQAEMEVRAGMLSDPAGLRRETVLLKREIAVMLRVVDGCAALCRGYSMRLGSRALAYTPQGRAIAARPSASACELQG